MNLLSKDLLLDAARKRRKSRCLSAFTLAVLPAAALSFLLVNKQSSDSSPDITSASETVESSPELPYTPIHSEEELLALLSDLSPILATRPDGSRTLILTNPQ